MRRFIISVASLCAAVSVLGAQTKRPIIEVRPFAGAYLPTGGQRDIFENAPMFGLQAALEMRPTVHLLGSFGWVPSHQTYGVGANDVNIYMYDAGVEVGIRRPLGARWELKPFLGMGGGLRSYEFRSDQLIDKTCLAGYGAAGTEFQLGRTAVRVEARDNLYCYRTPFLGNDTKTRNDIGLALGLAYHLR